MSGIQENHGTVCLFRRRPGWRCYEVIAKVEQVWVRGPEEGTKALAAASETARFVAVLKQVV